MLLSSLRLLLSRKVLGASLLLVEHFKLLNQLLVSQELIISGLLALVDDFVGSLLLVKSTDILSVTKILISVILMD